MGFFDCICNLFPVSCIITLAPVISKSKSNMESEKNDLVSTKTKKKIDWVINTPKGFLAGSSYDGSINFTNDVTEALKMHGLATTNTAKCHNLSEYECLRCETRSVLIDEPKIKTRQSQSTKISGKA